MILLTALTLHADASSGENAWLRCVRDDDRVRESCVGGGIEIRMRPEVRSATRFRDDDALVRVLQNLKGILHATRGDVSAHVELQDVRSWGDRNSLSGEPGAYVHQGYVQIGSEETWLRIGRQEMRIQKGLFVGDAPFNIARRSFDAVRGQAVHEGLQAEAFVTMLTPPTRTTALEPATTGEVLSGGFLGLAPTGGFEATAMLFAASAHTPAQAYTWAAPGLRLEVAHGAATVDVQGLFYTGRSAGVPIRAGHLVARYDQGIDAPLAPSIALMTDLSSGHGCAPGSTDVCATDRIGEPQLLFGRNHYLRGLADQMAGTNLLHAGAEVALKPTDHLATALQAHGFGMAVPTGAWRTPPGGLIGFDVDNPDRALAAELDLLATWTPLEGVTLQGAYALVRPLAAGRRIGGDRTNHVAWLETIVRL